MSRNVSFVKIAKYETRPDRGGVFEYLCQLCSQQIDPHSTLPNSLVLKSDLVLHSPLLRAVESILVMDGISYQSRIELAECRVPQNL